METAISATTLTEKPVALSDSVHDVMGQLDGIALDIVIPFRQIDLNLVFFGNVVGLDFCPSINSFVGHEYQPVASGFRGHCSSRKNTVSHIG